MSDYGINTSKDQPEMEFGQCADRGVNYEYFPGKVIIVNNHLPEDSGKIDPNIGQDGKVATALAVTAVLVFLGLIVAVVVFGMLLLWRMTA